MLLPFSFCFIYFCCSCCCCCWHAHHCVSTIQKSLLLYFFVDDWRMASKVSDVDWICVANCCLVSLFKHYTLIHRIYKKMFNTAAWSAHCSKWIIISSYLKLQKDNDDTSGCRSLSFCLRMLWKLVIFVDV